MFAGSAALYVVGYPIVNYIGDWRNSFLLFSLPIALAALLLSLTGIRSDELASSKVDIMAGIKGILTSKSALACLISTGLGLGVWQIDTTSFYSIVNINSMIKLVKNLCGRVSFIPLTLCLGPLEVTPPGMTKKTVHVMHINQDIKLAELQQWGQREPTKALLPEPDATEPPEDLFPDAVIDDSELTLVPA